MSPDRSQPTDRHLREALVRGYAARAVFFHAEVRKARISALFRNVDAIDLPPDAWTDLGKLKIERASFDKLVQEGIKPSTVFVHPDVLLREPQLVAYYRNLMAVSQKGMSQLGIGTARFERSRPPAMPEPVALKLAEALNPIASALVAAVPVFRLGEGRQVVLAELGTEIQGAWVNSVGSGASKQVEGMLAAYLVQQGCGTREGAGRYLLSNGWRIVMGPEPDVAFEDAQAQQQIVIEIKGSLDRAGAQTRYGEAMKTFRKALRRNPRCHTIYLASCFTESVSAQIESDGQVRAVFNLTSILHDPAEQEKFLKHLFHIVNAPR